MRTVLEVLTAIVALAAFVLSVINFRLTGSFVRVKVSPGLQLYDSTGKRARGNFVSVIAYNLGRTEVEVGSAGFVYDGAEGRVWLAINPLPGSNLGPTLPHTLRPGHSGSWILDAEQIEKDVAPTQAMKAYVTLGDDKVRQSHKSYKSADLLPDKKVGT